MKLFELLLTMLQSIFRGPKTEEIPDRIKLDLDPPKEINKESDKMEINWEDPNCKLGRYFKVKDALWLPRWNRLANESDGLTQEFKYNLIRLFKKLDIIRDYIGKPITVHVAYRSPEYNDLVKGSKTSAHMKGQAVDWSANMGLANKGEDCDKIRTLLEPCLEQWKLRMEDMPKANWVHIDIAEVKSNRYFKP